MESLERRQPSKVPYLIGRSEIWASAQSDALDTKATLAEEERDAENMGVLTDPVLINAYVVNTYRRCLSGPYLEGTVRSQRYLFGVSWFAQLECRR